MVMHSTWSIIYPPITGLTGVTYTKIKSSFKTFVYIKTLMVI